MNNMTDDNDKRTYCDICCLQPDGKLQWKTWAQLAIVDGPTRYGSWSYMCERHLQSAGYPKSRQNIDISVRKGQQ